MSSETRLPQTEHLPARNLLGLVLVSSALQYLSFFPVNFGFLGWVALVPLLLTIKLTQGPRAGWIIWAIAFCQFLASLRWMMVADERMIATWVLLAWWCSLFPWAAWKILLLLDRKTSLPLAFTAPLVWVPLEHARAYLLTGFPWYYLAHTQHDSLALLQTADFAGTQFLSALVAMWNGWLADLLSGAKRISPPWPVRPVKRSVLAASGAMVLSMTAFGLAYGTWRIPQVENAITPGPLVVAMQADHPQSARNDAAYFERIWEDYKLLLARAKRFEPDLIIWPETSFPFEIPVRWGQEGPLLGRRKDGEKDPEFSGPAQLLGSGVVLLKDEKPFRRHNSSLFQDFKNGIVRRYDKIHRVPFGEYLPLRGIIPGMELLSPYEFDYSITAGDGFTRFPLSVAGGATYTFSTLICYEDSDFGLARQAAGADGLPPPDFLVNQSNDGWFKGTEEHEQHLAVARFRSVETRKALVRSVNMGVTAVVSPSGRVLEPTPDEGVPDGFRVGPDAAGLPANQWKNFKARPVLLAATVPITTVESPYLFFGDWLAWCLDCLLVLTVLWCLITRP